jgi:hypothetical protein
MSDAATVRDAGPFRRSLMLLITGIGVLAFIATLVLGAYAPDLRSGRNGGGHALSNAATGYSGLVRLAEATGRNPTIHRREQQLGRSEDLAVITPPSGSTDLSKVLEARGPRSTLIVMPKWNTQRQDSPAGWVAVNGLIMPFLLDNVLEPEFKIKVARRKSARAPLQSRSPITPSATQFREPPIMQTISGPEVIPLIVDSRGATVLGKVGDGNLYLLADPDLLNNAGLADRNQAAAALALLDELNSTEADGILFDVTSNGFGKSRNPLRLAFDPPFLAVTLVIFAALLLAGWQALVRFGAPASPTRAIAFGKAALVENAAAIVRKAGREVRLGERYAALARTRAAARFHLSPARGFHETDQALDRLRPDHPFSALARAAGEARSRADLAAAARALSRWIQETGK